MRVACRGDMPLVPSPVLILATLLLAVAVILAQTTSARAQSEARPSAQADASEEHVATRQALALGAGHLTRPRHDIGFAYLTWVGQFDYDALWPHRAPEPLRFKLEASAGLTTWPFRKAVISGVMMAQYYLDALGTRSFRPYGEGGVGLIYTDFRIEGQGLRVNFNPQLGIGADLGADAVADPAGFVALRGWHVSNAGLDDDNTGLNGFVLQLGVYF